MNCTILSLSLNGLFQNSPFLAKERSSKLTKFAMSNVNVRNSFSTFLYFNKIPSTIYKSSFTRFQKTAIWLNSQDYLGNNFTGVAVQFTDATSLTQCTFSEIRSSHSTNGAVVAYASLVCTETSFTNCGSTSVQMGGGINAMNTLTITNTSFTNCQAQEGAAFYKALATGSTFTSNGITLNSCKGNSICWVSTDQSIPCSFISYLVQSTTLNTTTGTASIITVTSTSGIHLNHSRFELTESQTCLTVNTDLTLVMYNVNFTTTSAATSLANIVSTTSVTNYDLRYIQFYSPTSLGSPLFNTPASALAIRGSNIILNSTVNPAAAINVFTDGVTNSVTDSFTTDPLTVYIANSNPDMITSIGNSMIILPVVLFQGWDPSTFSTVPGAPANITGGGGTPTGTPTGSGTSSGSQTGTGTGTASGSQTGTGTGTGTAPTTTTTGTGGSGLSTLEIVLIVILVIILVFGIFAAIFICVRMHQGSMINERSDPTQRPPVFP